MADPETEPDAGTGSEPDNDPAAGGGEDTEDQSEGAEQAVPYGRFREVNERRKAAEARASEAEARAKAAEEKAAKLAEKPKADAPKGVDPTQLEAFVGDYLTRKLGMKPEDFKQVVDATVSSTRSAQLREWDAECRARNLDPADKAIRADAAALLDSGRYKSFGAALDRLSPKRNGKTPGRAAEADTISATMLSGEDVIPKGKDEAMRLASQGKTARYMTATEIFARTDAKK